MTFLVFAAIALVALLGYHLRQTKRWENCNEQDRAKLRAAIEADPKNIGAYELLGDSYRQSKQLDQACDWYKRALRFDVDETNHNVRYKLEHVQMEIEQAKAGFFSQPETWKRSKRVAAEVLFCQRCGASNPPHRSRCEVCGDLLLQATIVESIKEHWHDPHTKKALIVIALNCVFFTGVATLIFQLPAMLSGIIVISSFTAIVFVYLQRIDGSR
jgi:tetratricopeptide (TPR) repeat protein